ncbi:hypothetical protein FOZ61_008594 [Perkinsus olseni]|uniref:Uncharacterized protein n=1 Tax=Perkinsus olseni TaxID=32597 RepID=A0A7J6LB10_PEROL|nr:hypothetical protein FOZ61_008594 [Perkinsus olseni]KAF4656438.1 hypothetical protein FOL46_007833 [Perkinsus olseni]
MRLIRIPTASLVVYLVQGKSLNVLSCFRGLFGCVPKAEKDEPAVHYKKFKDDNPFRSRDSIPSRDRHSPMSSTSDASSGYWSNESPKSTNSDESVMDFSDIPGIVVYGHGDLPPNIFRKRSKPQSSPPIQKFVLQKPPLISPVWIPPEPPLNFVENHFEKVAPTPEPPEAKISDKPVEGDWAVVDVEEPPPEVEKDGDWTVINLKDKPKKEKISFTAANREWKDIVRGSPGRKAQRFVKKLKSGRKK